MLNIILQNDPHTRKMFKDIFTFLANIANFMNSTSRVSSKLSQIAFYQKFWNLLNSVLIYLNRIYATFNFNKNLKT